MIGLPLAPFPVTYRELWLPPSINENATLPTSVEGGHGLTLTGARKGTTCDGVHGISGVATSNINLGAIHNNENILYIKIRFKLDQPFAAGAPNDQYLFGKYDDPNNCLIGWLESTDGRFYVEHGELGVFEDIISTETSWDTGWHTILVSLHNVNGQRLIVDGGTPVVEAGNQTPITLTADFVLMARDDGVWTANLEGVMVDVVMGIAALTTAQEDDLYAGIPLAAATESYLLDEGRGTTAYNRGSSGAGADGTLDTSCTWKFGQVQQPVLSLDSINDRGVSSAGVDLNGALTLVWAGKIKSTYDGLAADHVLCQPWVDGNNFIELFYANAVDSIRYYVSGAASAGLVDYTIKPVIDDYIIFIGTLTAGGIINLFVNGSLIGTATGIGAIAGAATAYLGCDNTTANYDISKPLFKSLIDGAFSEKQALAYSRYLKNIFNLPIAI